MHPISFKFMQLLSLNVEYYFAPGSSTSCVDVVCINASLCINAAGAPCIYFTFMKRTSLSIASTSVFLSLQYGNLIDFASVYKRIMKPRNDWFQQLKYEMERATAMTYSGNGGGGRGALRWEPGPPFLGFCRERLCTKWAVRHDGNKLFDDKWQPALRMKRRKTDMRSGKRVCVTENVYQASWTTPGVTYLRTYLFFPLACWGNTQRDWMTHPGASNPPRQRGDWAQPSWSTMQCSFQSLLPSFSLSQLAHANTTGLQGGSAKCCHRVHPVAASTDC